MSDNNSSGNVGGDALSPERNPQQQEAPPSPANIGLSPAQANPEAGNSPAFVDSPELTNAPAPGRWPGRHRNTAQQYQQPQQAAMGCDKPVNEIISLTSSPTSSYVPSYASVQHSAQSTPYGRSPNIRTREGGFGFRGSGNATAGGGGAGTGLGNGSGTSGGGGGCGGGGGSSGGYPLHGPGQYTPYVIGGGSRSHHHHSHSRQTRSSPSAANSARGGGGGGGGAGAGGSCFGQRSSNRGSTEARTPTTMAAPTHTHMHTHVDPVGVAGVTAAAPVSPARTAPTSGTTQSSYLFPRTSPSGDRAQAAANSAKASSTSATRNHNHNGGGNGDAAAAAAGSPPGTLRSSSCDSSSSSDAGGEWMRAQLGDAALNSPTHPRRRTIASASTSTTTTSTTPSSQAVTACNGNGGGVGVAAAVAPLEDDSFADDGRRLTVTAGGGAYEFTLPSPSNLLDLPGSTLSVNDSTHNASRGEELYSLLPSESDSASQTPFSPAITHGFMDRAYTSSEAQMALHRQQHEEARMRAALRAVGVDPSMTGDLNTTGVNEGGGIGAAGAVASDYAPHDGGAGSGGRAGGFTNVGRRYGGGGNVPSMTTGGGGGVGGVGGGGHFSTADAAAAAAATTGTGIGSPSGAATATTTTATAAAGLRAESVHFASGASTNATAAGQKGPTATLAVPWPTNRQQQKHLGGVVFDGAEAFSIPRSVTVPQKMAAAAASSLPMYTNSSAYRAAAQTNYGENTISSPLSVSRLSTWRLPTEERLSPSVAASAARRGGSVAYTGAALPPMSNANLDSRNSFGNLSFLKDPLAASVIMQQNRSALIVELERRREKLRKQLSQLQREATARNVFALVRSSSASQLQYLLQQKLANVNERDYNGCSPLHVAAGEGNQAIVRVLLSFGADVLAVDHHGRTPLDCAAANRHSGVGRYLLAVIRGKMQRESSMDGGGGGSFGTLPAIEKAGSAVGSLGSSSGGAATLMASAASLNTARLAEADSPSHNLQQTLRLQQQQQQLSPLQRQTTEKPHQGGADGESSLLAPHTGSYPSGASTPKSSSSSSTGQNSTNNAFPTLAAPSYLGGAPGSQSTNTHMRDSTSTAMMDDSKTGVVAADSSTTGFRETGSFEAGLPPPARRPQTVLATDITARTSTAAATTAETADAASGGRAATKGAADNSNNNITTGSDVIADDNHPLTMLRPLRPNAASIDDTDAQFSSSSSSGGVGGGGGGLLNPQQQSDSFTLNTLDNNPDTTANSFVDVGLQTFDDYRQDMAMVRSNWGAARHRSTSPLSKATPGVCAVMGDAEKSGTAATATVTAGGVGASNMTADPASLSTNRGLDGVGGGIDVESLVSAAGAGVTESHASYMSAGSGRHILHPWCGACGLSHPSAAPCLANACAAYTNYGDPFAQSMLREQQLATNEAAVGHNSHANHSIVRASGGAVTPVSQGMASPNFGDAPALPNATFSGVGCTEEDHMFSEALKDVTGEDQAHYSRYTTVSDTVSLIVCMCGLPGRGKSFISKRLVRYMNWKGVPCKVFNAGNYRRQLLGAEGTANADFFNPDNPRGKELRERMAELACEDLVHFLCDSPLAVGILDATNTTKVRRTRLKNFFAEEAKRYKLPYRLLFIESVCTDETIITENILRSKCDNDDFKSVKDTKEVIAEFRDRIQQYERVYETLEPVEDLSFIKIINVKHHVMMHKVHTGLGSRIAFFLMNLHPIAYPIYIALPGETRGDASHLFGGNERLTTAGEAYAIALKHFIQDRYVPNMVVLHATNRSVLATLQPLIADEDDDLLTNAVAAAATATTTPAAVSPADAAMPLFVSASGGRGGGAAHAQSGDGSQRVSPTGHRGATTVGVQERTGSSSSSGSKYLPAHPRLHRQGKERHIVSPTSALEQPVRPVKLFAATEEERLQMKAMAGGTLGDIPVVTAEPLPDGAAATARAIEEVVPFSVSTGGTAAAGEKGKLVSPVSSAPNGDDEDDEDAVEEVLCPVPGLDNINYGRFSGCSATWVREKYPRLSSLLYVEPDGSSNTSPTTTAGAPTTANISDSSTKVRKGGARMRDCDAGDVYTAAAKDNSSTNSNNEGTAVTAGIHVNSDTAVAAPDGSPQTTPTVAEMLSLPVAPPTHFPKMADALTCLSHSPTAADPGLSYCVQFPNGESCRQVNVRLEPALMAVMRTQSPVFVIAPPVPAEGMLAFFADVIPELAPTLRLPRHCVIEMGVKDDITVHRLLAAADDVCVPAPSSPFMDKEEIEETLKLATSIRSMSHPLANSLNVENHPLAEGGEKHAAVGVAVPP